MKAALQIPVIASLNGASDGGWVEYARLIEETGADALELNIYAIQTDSALSSAAIEGDKLDYGTRKGLHPLLRANIEREAVRVFAR